MQTQSMPVSNKDLRTQLHRLYQQKLAVDSGVWPLYRFDPRRIPKGEAPLHLDYSAPKAKVADYLRNESRFRMVERANPAQYKAFVEESQKAADRRFLVYSQLAGIKVPAFEATMPGGGNGQAEPMAPVGGPVAAPGSAPVGVPASAAMGPAVTPSVSKEE